MPVNTAGHRLFSRLQALAASASLKREATSNILPRSWAEKGLQEVCVSVCMCVVVYVCSCLCVCVFLYGFVDVCVCVCVISTANNSWKCLAWQYAFKGFCNDFDSCCDFEPNFDFRSCLHWRQPAYPQYVLRCNLGERLGGAVFETSTFTLFTV